MTNEQREEFFRLITAGVKEAEKAYLSLSGKAAAEHLKKLFEELVLAPAMTQQEKESTMTPREQIQEHARVAAKKVKEALQELHASTGIQGNVLISWGEDGSILASSIFSAKHIGLRSDDGGRQSICIAVDEGVDRLLARNEESS